MELFLLEIGTYMMFNKFACDSYFSFSMEFFYLLTLAGYFHHPQGTRYTISGCHAGMPSLFLPAVLGNNGADRREEDKVERDGCRDREREKNPSERSEKVQQETGQVRKVLGRESTIAGKFAIPRQLEGVI